MLFAENFQKSVIVSGQIDGDSSRTYYDCTLEYEPDLWTPKSLIIRNQILQIGVNSVNRIVLNKSYIINVQSYGYYFASSSSEYRFYVISTESKALESLKYLKTTPIKGLVYFPNQIRVLEIPFEKISKSILIDGKNISYDYFYASYENKHEQAVLEGAISILSILTSTFLLLGELSDGEIITSYNISGKSNNVPFFGSGVFQHPIEKSSLEKLYHEIGHYQFERLQWRYSNFVTSNDFVIQLFKGCNLLDYIAEISENILWKKINNRKSSKSNIIYTILIQLNLSIERTEILCLLFPELNWRKEETNSINDLKFDFYELRDSHVHRGQILEVDSDFPRYRNAIVALDEVIRIILPHLGVIKNWSLQNKDSIRSINAEGFVKERQKVMNWNKILE